MKFSHEWLESYVDIKEAPARVGERLTAAGLPLDGIESRGGDTLYDLDIFTNRPDCMSHLGVAREYAALTSARLRPPSTAIPAGGRLTREVASVVIEAPDLCARYAARCVLGVAVGHSPEWLRLRLESIGQRSINNVVDATNFVLWELGQPLHPFDLDRLEGRRIVVRRARAGERLTTLDGVERTLAADMPVIADAAKAVALAGIMGGEASQIGARTKNVLIESAWFEPVPVRRAARALGLHTDASHRFERGADPEAVLAALDRAAQIIAEIAGGTVASEPLDVYPRPAPPRIVTFRPSRARDLLGIDLDEAAMRAVLERLGFRIAAVGHEAWSVTAPSFRRDVEREADLIEEVARQGGYDAIPAALPLLPSAGEGRPAADTAFAAARRALQSAGLSEAINYAMVDREEALRFARVPAEPVALTNPLQTNASVLRTSLLPGLLRNAAHNFNHGVAGVHLFEIGAAFLPAGRQPEERPRLALIVAGRGLPVHWSLSRREADLYDAKGAVELLADLLGISPLAFSSDKIPFLEEGRSLRVAAAGRDLGVVGEIKASLRERFGIDRPVFAAEIDLPEPEALSRAVRRYHPLPRTPPARRDLAIVTGPGTTYEAIERTIRRSSTLPVTEVQAFDLYSGPGVPPGCASLAVQIVFQHPERTLLAQEVQESMDAITSALRRDLKATLRGNPVAE